MKLADPAWFGAPFVAAPPSTGTTEFRHRLPDAFVLHSRVPRRLWHERCESVARSGARHQSHRWFRRVDRGNRDARSSRARLVDDCRGARDPRRRIPMGASRPRLDQIGCPQTAPRLPRGSKWLRRSESRSSGRSPTHSVSATALRCARWMPCCPSSNHRAERPAPIGAGGERPRCGALARSSGYARGPKRCRELADHADIRIVAAASGVCSCSTIRRRKS